MIRLALLIVGDEKKASVPVFGIPAVRRLVLLARRLGCQAVHLIGRAPFSFAPLSDLVPDGMFHVAKDLGEARSLLDRLEMEPGERALVMRAEHVVDSASLEPLNQAGADNGLSYLDGDSPAGDWQTKVWLADREGLGRLVDYLWSGAVSAGAPAARRIASSTGLPTVILDADAEATAAEDKLVRSLGLATMEHDSFLSRFINRRLSRPISKTLGRTRVTANMVTLFNIAIGLAGALLLSNGHYWPQLFGSLLFLASVILDGVDGEVARLKLQESNLGHYLDIVGDNAVHVGVFAGIAVGLFRVSNDLIYPEALVFLLGGFGLCALAVNKTLGHGPDKKGSNESSWLTTLLANRDFAYLVVVCSLFARLDWFLFGTAVGVYLFAAVLFVLSARNRGDDASIAPTSGVTARHI